MSDGNNTVSATSNPVQNAGTVREYVIQKRWEIAAFLIDAAALSIITLGALAHFYPVNGINDIGSIAIMAVGSATFVLTLVALVIKHIYKKRQAATDTRQRYESYDGPGTTGGQAP